MIPDELWDRYGPEVVKTSVCDCLPGIVNSDLDEQRPVVENHGGSSEMSSSCDDWESRESTSPPESVVGQGKSGEVVEQEVGQDETTEGVTKEPGNGEGRPVGAEEVPEERNEGQEEVESHEDDGEGHDQKDLLFHAMIHVPKRKGCEACQREKMRRKPMRRLQEPVPRGFEANHFGEVITADHIIVATRRSLGNRGLQGETVYSKQVG